MTKMSEAFEKEYGFTWEQVGVDHLRNPFNAGYTAAIAAVKEGGPVAYIYTTDQGKGNAHLSYSRPELQDQDALADQEIVIDRLYKLPEDEK